MRPGTLYAGNEARVRNVVNGRESGGLVRRPTASAYVEVRTTMAKALLVESGDSGRETMRYLLATAGHQVIEAANSSVALKRMHGSQTPLVVILHMSFTAPDDVAMLAAIENDHSLRTRHTYIVLTDNPSRISTQLWERLTRLGVLVLQRPIHDRVLANAIELAANTARAWRQERAFA